MKTIQKLGGHSYEEEVEEMRQRAKTMPSTSTRNWWNCNAWTTSGIFRSAQLLDLFLEPLGLLRGCLISNVHIVAIIVGRGKHRVFGGLKLRNDMKSPILCFTALRSRKTSVHRRSIGSRISLWGARDEAEIRGHRRPISGATGTIIKP